MAIALGAAVSAQGCLAAPFLYAYSPHPRFVPAAGVLQQGRYRDEIIRALGQPESSSVGTDGTRTETYKIDIDDLDLQDVPNGHKTEVALVGVTDITLNVMTMGLRQLAPPFSHKIKYAVTSDPDGKVVSVREMP